MVDQADAEMTPIRIGDWCRMISTSLMQSAGPVLDGRREATVVCGHWDLLYGPLADSPRASATGLQHSMKKRGRGTPASFLLID
jgi:hypothetical protein